MMCNNYFIFEGKKKSLNSALQLYQSGRYFVILNFINYINMLKKNASFYCHLEEKAEIFT